MGGAVSAPSGGLLRLLGRTLRRLLRRRRGDLQEVPVVDAARVAAALHDGVRLLQPAAVLVPVCRPEALFAPPIEQHQRRLLAVTHHLAGPDEPAGLLGEAVSRLATPEDGL